MAAGLTVRNVAGFFGGLTLAPAIGLIAWARRGRMFHPTGVVLAAGVRPIAGTDVERAAAERLAGPALLRWSSALWKRRSLPDVFGCAIRFTNLPFQAEARPSDQDLLFATIRRPWTMLFSPLTTRHRDFLANHYYAVSPFAVSGLGRVEWRLRPLTPIVEVAARDGEARAERLIASTIEGTSFVLEYAPYRAPWRIRDERPFRPLAVIELRAVVAVDQARLRFDPFRSGRGVTPVGFVQWLRRATYASSRLQPLSAPLSGLSGALALGAAPADGDRTRANPQNDG